MEDTKLSDPLIGEVVGEYRIKARLGSGGMGIVYRGVHLVIGKAVAIKILRTEGDAEHTQRLLAEARTVSTLRHRGITDIFGFGTLGDGRPYVVMELLEGKPLDAELRDRGTMAVDEALWILEEALGPMAVAHSSGVVHRDIKPSNFFISEEADGSRYLKILDFGLAKRRSGENLTAIGSVLGTPDYMSPEQAQAKQVGPGADLYSLGAMAFELIAGAPPFIGTTPMAIMMQQVHSEAPRVSSKVSSVPVEVDELIAQMLEKDPGKRPASAAELKARVVNLRKKYARENTASAPAPAAPGPLPPEPSSSPRNPATADLAAKSSPGAPPLSPEPASSAKKPAAPALAAEPVSRRTTSAARARPSSQPSPVVADGTPASEAMAARAAPASAEVPPKSPTLKWILAAVTVAALVGIAWIVLLPAGEEGIPNTPPEPAKLVVEQPPVKEKIREVVVAPDLPVAKKADGGGAAVVRDHPTEVDPDPDPEKTPAKVATKRTPPPQDKSVEARIKKDEAVLKAKARGGDVDPIAAGFLRSFKDELKKNPASRERVTRQLAEWERKFLR